MFQTPKGSKYTRNKQSLYSQKCGNGTQIYENETQKIEDQMPKIMEKSHYIFSSIEKLDQNHNSHKIYTDQTGQFPIR